MRCDVKEDVPSGSAGAEDVSLTLGSGEPMFEEQQRVMVTVGPTACHHAWSRLEVHSAALGLLRNGEGCPHPRGQLG